MTTVAASVSARPTRVLGAVAITVTAWASAFVAIRSVRDSFEPGALALGRLLVGTIALGALLLVRRAWISPTQDLPALQVTWMGCTVGAIACLPFAPKLALAGVSVSRRR